MKKFLMDLQKTFINSKFYERIRYLRKYRNLTIKQAADKCIIAEKCWADWEAGRAIPRPKNKKRIAAVLGVSVETIFGEVKACIL